MAAEMWAKMDKMAKEDPKAYKKFMAKQREEHAKELQREKKQKEERMSMLPVFKFVVTTTRTDIGNAKKVYVNFCTSKGVPACQKPDGTLADDDEPSGNTVIPLSVGPLMDFKNKQGKSCKACDVVVHPKTIARALRDMQFKLFLVEIGLQYMEEDFKQRFHRAYKVLEGEGYCGPQTSPVAQRTEMGIAEAKKQAKLNAFKEGQQLRAHKEVVLPFTAKGERLAKQSEELEPSLLGEGGLKLTKETGMKDTGKAKRSKPLIQVVADTPSSFSSSSSQASSSSASASKAQTPEFSCTHNTEAKTIELVVRCPAASSAADLEIDIDDSKVLLGGALYELEFSFPRTVDGDRAVAKFKKKKKLLRITAPLLPSN
jgi:hypothetical protein